MNAEKIIEIENGKKIAYSHVGDISKSPVVMLSGSAFNYKQFYPVFLPELKNSLKNNSIILYDYIGIGNSTSERGDYDFVTITQEHIQFLDALGIEKAHHFGYSKGAIIGLLAAGEAPDRISSLGAYGTPNLAAGNDEQTKTAYAERMQYLRGLTGIWDKVIDEMRYKLLYDSFYVPVIFGEDVNHLSLKNKIKSRSVKKSLKPMLVGTLLRNIVNLYDYYRREITVEEKERYLEHMKNINQPILMMHGTKDEIVSFENAKSLSEVIPNANLVKFKDYTHTEPILRKGQGKKVIDTYVNFLKSL